MKHVINTEDIPDFLNHVYVRVSSVVQNKMFVIKEVSYRIY